MRSVQGKHCGKAVQRHQVTAGTQKGLLKCQIEIPYELIES